MTDPEPELVPENSPDLVAAVTEIERHLSRGGWDQPLRLYALVPTADLLAAQPDLAGSGVDAAQRYTGVEQTGLPDAVDDEQLARLLATIEWPSAVTGCVLAIERLVDPGHEVRMTAGVLRDGSIWGVVRLREYDADDAVLTGTDVVGGLCEVLATTLIATPDGVEFTDTGTDGIDGTDGDHGDEEHGR